MEKRQSKQKKKKKFFGYLFLLLIGITVLALISLFLLNVLPFTYFLIIAIVLFLFDLIMYYLLLGSGWKRRFFGTVLSSLKIILLSIFIFYSLHTYLFLNQIKGGNYNTENYSVIVLNTSKYEKIKELKTKKIGIMKLGEDKGLIEAKKHLNKKIDFIFRENNDLTSLLNQFKEEEVDAILLESAEKSILEEEHPEIKELEKIIYEFSIDIKMEDDLVKNVDITSAPFSIFISGIDSYGKISSVSRSDVNMVATINPKSHEILITSIPRDYFVSLHGIETNYKDKLTHAGIYGIDTSVKTIEDLLDIDINYYMKVNFTSLVDIVNQLGGIDVEVEEPFRAYYEEEQLVNYTFQKGINHLNGKQALAFVRERKSLAKGDVARAEHQQIVLEALINKALSKTILTKYNDLLKSLEGKFVTNMGTVNITNLIKNQIKENTNWTIKRNILEGTDAYKQTYSYRSKKVYVMEPTEESIEKAKILIKEIKGE